MTSWKTWTSRISMTPELAALKSNVEDAIDVHLPAASALAQPLVDAMRYPARVHRGMVDGISMTG